jgi:hypothetical protein
MTYGSRCSFFALNPIAIEARYRRMG